MNPEKQPFNPDAETDKEEFAEIRGQGTEYSPEINKITFQAAEMPMFRDAVRQAKTKINAIIRVRELLREHFPGIPQIPEPQRPMIKIRKSPTMRLHQAAVPAPSNEFKIAKDIVELLFK